MTIRGGRLGFSPWLVVLLLGAAVLAACAVNSDSNGVEERPTSPQDPPPTVATGNPAPDQETLDHYGRMISCLADYGIAAEYDPKDGGLTLDFGGMEEAAVTEAIMACRAADGLPSEPDEEYLRSYYQFLVQLYQCLAGEGFPVPELVTEDVFIEEGGYWHPYDVLWAHAEAAQTGRTPELIAAMTVCPNDPDDPRWGGP